MWITGQGEGGLKMAEIVEKNNRNTWVMENGQFQALTPSNPS